MVEGEMEEVAMDHTGSHYIRTAELSPVNLSLDKVRASRLFL
jgi:hypothetical protein